MTKKGPLGTAEMFYVEGKYKDKDVKDIAKDLDRPLVTIQKYVDKCVEREPATATKSGSLMARREGVVLMTESASAMSDDTRSKKGNRSRKSCVTRIKND